MRTQRGRIITAVLGTVAVLVLAGAVQAAPIDVTQPGDPIVGVHNTFAGGLNTLSTTGSGSGQFPDAEAPMYVIDNNAGKKYLNFGGTGISGPGENTGFYVTPSMGASIVTGLHFAAANDSPERDPLRFTLEGTNSNPATATDWVLIATDDTGLASDPGRSQWQVAGSEPTFANSTAYTSYRLLFPTVRGANQNSMQIAEIEILTPEPATMGLLLLGAVSVLRKRRSR